ncbi:MAG: hypothetical protein VST67_13625 [Nitrospirota bacterium]|nr:hypothetical protein [Nitrospirota bacterium]
MEPLPELVGTVHIIFGPYRGNPIALYMLQDGSICQIAPRIYPWNRTVGIGDTPNRAAADFENKWKQAGLADEMYTGPHWEGGIKPEKPKPPPKPAAPPSPKPEAKVDTQASAPGTPVTSTESNTPPPSKTTDTAPQETPAS